jgi:hypothetical protein
MTFAWLFYRATGGKIGIYFASRDPIFSFINGLTWVVVLFVYADLIRFLWQARDALFHDGRRSNPSKKDHAYEAASS